MGMRGGHLSVVAATAEDQIDSAEGSFEEPKEVEVVAEAEVIKILDAWWVAAVDVVLGVGTAVAAAAAVAIQTQSTGN